MSKIVSLRKSNDISLHGKKKYYDFSDDPIYEPSRGQLALCWWEKDVEESLEEEVYSPAPQVNLTALGVRRPGSG